jgi:hypothetical protein
MHIFTPGGGEEVALQPIQRPPARLADKFYGYKTSNEEKVVVTGLPTIKRKVINLSL